MAKPLETLTESELKLERERLETAQSLSDIEKQRLKYVLDRISALKEERSITQDLAKSLSKRLKLEDSQSEILKSTVISFKEMGESASSLYKTVLNLKNGSTMFFELLNLSVDRFIELDNVGQSFRETTGFLSYQTSQVETNIRTASRDLARFGVSAESAKDAAQGLANAFGDTTIANKENIEYVSLMKENLGVASEDSVNLLQNFMGIGAMSSKVARETAGAAANLTKAAGVPFNKVMKEVADTSDNVRSLIRGSVDSLIKGAIEAKRLGTSLESVGRAAAGFLDFQSSINDEMEASVLFGKDINLQKARELSYDGDLKGLAKERNRLLQEAGDVSKMDYYQRIAIAKALGMSVKEMDDMNAKQQEMNVLRRESPELYKQLTADLDTLDNINESVTEKYQKELKAQQLAGAQKKMMNDIQQIVVEISEALLPVVKLLFAFLVPILKIGAAIVSFILTPIRWMNDGIDYFLNKFGGASKIVSPVAEGFQKMYDSISNCVDKFSKFLGITEELSAGIKGIVGLVGTIAGFLLFKEAIQSIKGILIPLLQKIPIVGKFLGGGTPVVPTITKPSLGPPGMGGYGSTISPTTTTPSPAVPPTSIPPTPAVPSAAGAATSSIPSVPPTANKTAGQNIKDFLKNLADGIKSFNPLGEILKGLLGITLSGPAFLLFIPAIPGILSMAAVGAMGKLITEGFKAISEGIKLMDISVIGMGILGIAASGPAFVLFIPAIPGILLMAAVGAIGPLITKGFDAVATGIKMMDIGVIGMGILGIAASGPAFLLFIPAIPGILLMSVIGAMGPLITKGFKAISEGIKLMDISTIGKGLLGIAASGPAFLLFIPAIPGLLLMSAVGAIGPLITKGFDAISEGIKMMDIGAIGKGLLGVAASGSAFLLFIPAIPGILLMTAVGTMGKLITKGFDAISEGIKLMDIGIIGKGLLGIAASGPAFLLFIPAIPGILLMTAVGAMGPLITKGFKAISEGIKLMDIGIIGKGLLGVAASGSAFLLFIPAIPGLLLMSAVGAMGPLITKGFIALSTGIKMMDISVIGMGILGVAASGPAFLLFMPAIPGILLMSAVGAMGPLITEGFKAISIGIKMMDIGAIGKGLLGVAASGSAFLLFIPAIPGILLMAAVGAIGPLIVGGFTALSIGIKMMDIGIIGKGLLGIAASGPAFLLFIPAIPGILLMTAVGAMGPLIVGGFTALSTGIKTMDISVIGKGLLGISASGSAFLLFIPAIPGLLLMSTVGAMGKLITEGFKSISTGIKTMDIGVIGKGLIGVTASGPAFLSFIPAIPGILLMSAVGAMGSLIVGGFTALSIGIKMMDIGVIGKGLLGIAASGPAFLLFIPTIPGLLLMSAVGAIGPLIVGGFTALSTGIKMMDIGVIGKGLLGISALGLSIIPFAFAMTLFSDVNWTGVIAGAAALVIFAAAAFGLGALLAGPGAIIFGVGVIGITALGVAMLPLAMAAKLAGEGMKNFGDGVKDIAANISQIASLEETLSIFKDQELIAGIYSMGFAIAFLNTQLSALGTNLPALVEINKSKNEQSANGEVVAKLDELIGLMQSGAIAVNIDGTKVSTAVGVATKFRGAS